jgi:hypothetical protein
MVKHWVWDQPKEAADWGADMDYSASAPMHGTEYLNGKWLDPEFYKPVFRSRTSLKKFRRLHCPPIDVSPAVDSVWRDIILEFVPEDRVQFLPIRLVARGEVCDDYYWPIVMDRVVCIDPERSVVTRQLKDESRFFIFGVSKFIHFPECMGNRHLCRDARMESHLLVSDELKEALAATGENSMFYRPDDVVTIDGLIAKARIRHLH